jgi:hypothetical protein
MSRIRTKKRNENLFYDTSNLRYWVTKLENGWKRWTQKEIQYLIKNYPLEDMEKMINILGRSEIAINIRANNLKLKRARDNSIFKRIENSQRKLIQ